MTTTEQRSGFRLPWASDPRPDPRADDQAQPAADDSPAAEDTPAAEEATTESPTNPEAPSMQDTTTTPDPRALAWPGADAPAEPGPAAAAPEPPPARTRRDNPLVVGLVRAMRDAATTARQEAAARFAEEAKSRVEALHARSVEEAAQLRRQADTEVGEIRDWSKAQMARIREETDERIADRRRRLESDVAAHAEQVEHRVERVQAAIGDFEQRMDAFFERLLAEEDPARLAGLAEQLPEPPIFDIDSLDDLTPAGSTDTLDASGAAAAEAEALAGLDEPDLDGAEAGALPAGASDDVTAAEADAIRRLDAFTDSSATASEAVTSRLAVVGLVSVASIAGFKRGLARTSGVRSVAVASGPTGDFVFTVTHDPDTDLPTAVAALVGFAAVVTGDTDGVITVTATDPERAQ